jgi:DnaJ domain
MLPIQIRKSFKELSKQCHPDWARQEDQASAATRFKRLNAAYQELVQSGVLLHLPNALRKFLWLIQCDNMACAAVVCVEWRGRRQGQALVVSATPWCRPACFQ